MNLSQTYLMISILVLAVITLLVFFVGKNKKAKNINPSARLAFGFILAGLFFGENRFVGYGFMGIGVLLAAVDIFYRSRKNNPH